MTREDKLVLLIEEAGEIIQAATKCLRFGYDYNHPGYGVNSEMLAKEIGDLLGVVDELVLDKVIIRQARNSKMARAVLAQAEYGIPLGQNK